jgi:hypothetical protein
MGLLSVALLSVGLASGAAGPDSGPPVGSKVEPLTAFVTVGERAGEAADLASERGGKPTVYVFVQADRWDRPMARFVRALDRSVAEGGEGLDEAEVEAVWLTDDAPAAKEYQPRGQMSLNLARTRWTVFEGGRLGPNGWAINPDAFLTVVSVRDGKVAGRSGFLSVGEEDVPGVLEWLVKP